jgi:hypothetical protein
VQHVVTDAELQHHAAMLGIEAPVPIAQYVMLVIEPHPSEDRIHPSHAAEVHPPNCPAIREVQSSSPEWQSPYRAQPLSSPMAAHRDHALEPIE